MELSRRDAVAALAAIGAGAGGLAAVSRHRRPDGDASGPVSAMVAAAEVCYPSEVEGVDTFVRAFLEGRLDSEAHAAGVEEAVADLDRYARGWHDAPFADLSMADREDTLRSAGVDTADERPDGGAPERIRYYVVNELLLALYASPTGGELVGIENPQGHAGGLDTYQRGPDS